MNIKVKEREMLSMELNTEEKKHLDLYYMKDKEIPFNESCNQEYEARDDGFEIVRQGLPPELEGCGFGDEFFMFEGVEGHPKYQDVNEVWDLFIQWIEKGQRQMLTLQKDEESYEYWIGSQLIDFARKRNTHSSKERHCNERKTADHQSKHQRKQSYDHPDFLEKEKLLALFPEANII